MTIGLYIKKQKLRDNPGLRVLLRQLEDADIRVVRVDNKEKLRDECDLLMSVGGDGTFLSAAQLVADAGIPILGVNLGRIGFLSENTMEDVAAALADGKYSLEERSLLQTSAVADFPYALNEVSVHRKGMAILGIDVALDGEKLPTYWADGLLVATASGSTAYSLSAGGPICRPDAKVLIISPVAPHNLNVRPLVVPDSCKVSIKVSSRDGAAMLGLDNRAMDLDLSKTLDVRLASKKIKRVVLKRPDFMKALRSKLFWGEDIRNSNYEDRV